MKSLLILCILFMVVSSLPTELNLPVRPETQQKLTLSLQRLAGELQYFKTPYENKTKLYKRVAVAEQYLQELTSQVSQYDNVIQGVQNSVAGSKNIIVGNFNSLRGNNNYVFIQKYTGQANGDLLIGKWRIEIEKKRFILINSTYAISFINEETNRKYLRYLTENRQFSFGSTNGESIVTLVKDDTDSFANAYNYGSSSQNLNNQNQKDGLLVTRNFSPQSFIPIRASVPPLVPSLAPSSVQVNIPQSPALQVSPVRQSDYGSNQQIISISNPIIEPFKTFQPDAPAILSSNPTQVPETAFMSRRSNDEQVITTRLIQPVMVQQVPQNQVIIASQPSIIPSPQVRGSPQQTGYVNNLFSTNRLQMGAPSSTPSNNLRSESQAQQSDQTNSVGIRFPRPSTQNGPTFSTTINQQKISISNTPKSPLSQSTSINLASWRNRS